MLINLRKAAAQSSGLGLDDFTRHTTLSFDDGRHGLGQSATLVFKGATEAGETGAADAPWEACDLPNLRDFGYYEA